MSNTSTEPPGAPPVTVLALCRESGTFCVTLSALSDIFKLWMSIGASRSLVWNCGALAESVEAKETVEAMEADEAEDEGEKEFGGESGGVFCIACVGGVEDLKFCVKEGD